MHPEDWNFSKKNSIVCPAFENFSKGKIYSNLIFKLYYNRLCLKSIGQNFVEFSLKTEKIECNLMSFFQSKGRKPSNEWIDFFLLDMTDRYLSLTIETKTDLFLMKRNYIFSFRYQYILPETKENYNRKYAFIYVIR